MVTDSRAWEPKKDKKLRIIKISMDSLEKFVVVKCYG
jgi:hypothetical protein